MRNRKVLLGRTVRPDTPDPEGLIKTAEALAASLTLPADVEFARFRHKGRDYALSARILVEVDRLDFRTPEIVIRRGARPGPK